MSYSIHEFDTFPFQMAIVNDDIAIIDIGRHAYGTNDTLLSVTKRPENIKQFASILQLVERANRAEAAEAERDDLRRQLEQAQTDADQRLEMLYSMRGFLYGCGYTGQTIEAYLNALDKEIEAQP